MPTSRWKITCSCLAVDRDHHALPHLVGWLKALAADPAIDSISALTPILGRHDLPDNVRVHTIAGRSKLKRVADMLSFVARDGRSRRPDLFLVFQGGGYPIIFLPFKLWWRRPLFQWKAHAHADIKTRLMARFCDDLVFTASPSSFRLDLPGKVVVLGHAIDTDLFRPHPRPRCGDVVAVGRVAPVKHLERMVDVLARCRALGRVVRLDLIGKYDDPTYLARLKEHIARLDLQDQVRFVGTVPFDSMAEHLSGYALAYNFQNGALDKAVLEAMACQLPLVGVRPSAHEAMPEHLRESLTAELDDTETLARHTLRILDMGEAERQALGQELRRHVVAAHGLDSFPQRLLGQIRRWMDKRGAVR